MDSHHHSTGKARAADAEGGPHPSPSDCGKPRCRLEDKVVANGTTARMVLVFLRDFVENGQVFGTFESQFSCPMLRCFERFTEPLSLIQHLLSCPCLAAGEFGCGKCETFHSFPVKEEQWEGFSGWKPCAQPGLRQKRSLGSKMKGFGIKLVTPRRSGSSSSISSYSASSISSPNVNKRLFDDFPNHRCETPYQQVPYHSPVHHQVPEKTPSQFAPASQEPIAEFPLNEVVHQLDGEERWELAPRSPSEDGMVDPTGNTNRLHYGQARQHAQSSTQVHQIQQPRQVSAVHENQHLRPDALLTPLWSSYSSSGSGQSVHQGKPDDRGMPPSHGYLLSPQSSVDGGTSHIQNPGQGQILEGTLTASPVELEDAHAGKQTWTAHMQGHSSSSASSWNPAALQTQQQQQSHRSQQQRPEAQIPSCAQTSAANVPAEAGIGSWSPNDDADPMLLPWDSEARHIFGDALQRSFANNSDNASDNQARHQQYAAPNQHHAGAKFGPLNQARNGGDEHAPWMGLVDQNGRRQPPPSELDVSILTEHLDQDVDADLALDEQELGQSAADIHCDECTWRPRGRERNFRGYLRKHKQTHNGRKLPCDVPGCESMFSRQDNLKKHKKEKHGIVDERAGYVYRNRRPLAVPAELEASVPRLGITRGGILRRQQGLSAADFIQGTRRGLLQGQGMV